MSVSDLEKLLTPHIGENKTITKKHVTSLVGPGENFGGELFKIDVTIKDLKTSDENVLYLVGKIIPKDQKLQEAFNIQKTFKSEIAFYEKIVPALQNFQRDNNIKEILDCFPRYYGSRLNLNGSEIVDRDGVILLENLKVKGYNNLDRHVGYNLEEAKILLKDLAQFQSTVTALKIHQPDVFKEEIKSHCDNLMKHESDNPLGKLILLIETILMESETCRPLISKMRDLWGKHFPFKTSRPHIREPFASLRHCDLWVNNAMMKYNNDTPTANKFVDFQIYDYGSPAADVLNFIFTSVQTEVSKKSFDDLLHHYHAEFVSNLTRLGCKTELFSYSSFLKELELESEAILVWTIGFVPMVVFGKKSDSFEEGPMVNYDDPQIRQKMLDNIMPEAKQRMFYILEELHKRNWI